MTNDPVLESKHKIFLSHSGVQKEFVVHLCKALEACCCYPFFDRRHESLPKGKRYPGLIIEAAQQCQLFVVVVSEEYFMSKWPMIELNTFVQASKVSNVNADILPLFYGLSVDELKNKERRQRWLEKWKTFCNNDPVEGRIKLEDWSFAINELTKFNGLSYNQKLKDIEAYENEIVSYICTSVLPDIKWHDAHVQGNVHEVLFDKMKPIGLSQKYKMKVVGTYGVGGIGKTTTCKMLCNKLLDKYEGRVCNIELDSACSKELLQNAIIKLIKKSPNFVWQLQEEGECKYILYKNLFKQRTFLAIDNVSDDDNSIKQARMFLDFRFHIDSLVLVTARSQSILVGLGIDEGACLEMPELAEEDAIKLFLFYAAPGEQFTTKEDMDSIRRCVKRVSVCKDDGGGYYYNPYELETLSERLRDYQEKPIEWEKHLPQLSIQLVQSKKEDLRAHLQVDYQSLMYAITRKALYLNAFKQLQVLDLSWSRSLTKMDGMDGLPELQNLNLYHCVSLEHLPDLRKSKSLEEVNLIGCIGLQIYVKDFEMLATLPLLRLVLFSDKSEQKKNKLDIHEKKVLLYLGPTFDARNSWLAWKEGELEELELGHSLAKIGNPSHCDTYKLKGFNVEELENIESHMGELENIESHMGELEDIESNKKSCKMLNLVWKSSIVLTLTWTILNLTWKIFRRPMKSHK